MARQARNWHPKFLEYMDFIINHENYKGLPIEYKSDGQPSWIATAQSEIGIARTEWALRKAKELGIDDGPGVYAKVMFEIHPTKEKVCQVCGRVMSIRYIYPNYHMVRAIKKTFDFDCDELTSISNVFEELESQGISADTIKKFLIDSFSLDSRVEEHSLDKIIKLCEQKSRAGHSKYLGPGAMSNFPDRFDGFHTYNRCCRHSHDKGRSKENLRSYIKDRRAYEYWSDGNIHAANKFMVSSFFKGRSADHVGPISLGFVHDSNYLRAMSIGENVSKRDRLLFEDIQELISIEEDSGVCAMSWYSADIWEYIKDNYEQNPEQIDSYRLILKQNMASFMFVLWTIIDSCGQKGLEFLEETLLRPKMKYFRYNYKFNEYGKIIRKTPRNITDSTRKEYGRFVRIAFKAVMDYNEKENRNIKIRLSSTNKFLLMSICKDISNDEPQDVTLQKLVDLMKDIQRQHVGKLERP